MKRHGVVLKKIVVSLLSNTWPVLGSLHEMWGKIFYIVTLDPSLQTVVKKDVLRKKQRGLSTDWFC